MRCKNCGGIISDTVIICPFCGWENEILAGRQQEREITRITEKTRDFSEKPKNAARQASFMMYRVIAAVLILFVLATVTVYCGNQLRSLQSKDEYRHQQEALRELEALYVAGDFEAIDKMLRSNSDYSSATYSKYSTMSRLYSEISWYEGYSESSSNHIASYPEDAGDLDSVFQTLFGLLGECEQMKDKGYVYGEEELVADISLRTKVVLQKYYLLTDAEILQGIDISKDETPDYSGLREISASRLSGGTA